MTAEALLSLQTAIDFLESACEQSDNSDEFLIPALSAYFGRCFELSLVVLRGKSTEAPTNTISNAYRKHYIEDMNLWQQMLKTYSSGITQGDVHNISTRYLAGFKQLLYKINPTAR